jgi:hypothetical protein
MSTKNTVNVNVLVIKNRKLIFIKQDMSRQSSHLRSKLFISLPGEHALVFVNINNLETISQPYFYQLMKIFLDKANQNKY